MRKFYLIIFLAIPIFGFTQSSYLKSIEKGKYSKLEKKIDKSLEKNPADIELNYYKARLLMESDYKNYNPKQSYKILVDLKSSYRKVDEKERKKLEKIPLNADVINRYIDTVCFRALNDAIKLDKEEGYQDYLNYYTLTPTKYLNSATENRNRVAFDNACKVNTPEAFQQFMTKYPKAAQYSSAKSKRNALEFTRAKTTDNIESYKAFIAKYPDADEVNLAWERIHEIAFDEAKQINTSHAYLQFITNYPNSIQYNKAYGLMEDRQYSETVVVGEWGSYYWFCIDFPENRWKHVAQDSIYELACIERNLFALKYCVENLHGEKRNKSLLLLHEVFTNDGEKNTLDEFYKSFNDQIFNNIKPNDYTLAEAGDKLLLHLPYDSKLYKNYDEYIKLAAPNAGSTH